MPYIENCELWLSYGGCSGRVLTVNVNVHVFTSLPKNSISNILCSYVNSKSYHMMLTCSFTATWD